MQPAGTKMVATRRSGVVPGSVWESRMRLDQVKGGVKVFDADDDGGGGGGTPGRRMARTIPSPNASTTEKRKRRNWTTTADSDKRPPTVLRKTKSEPPSPAPEENSAKSGESKATAVRSLSESAFQAVAPTAAVVVRSLSESAFQAAAAAEEEDGGAEEDEVMKVETEEEGVFDDKEVDLHAGEEEEDKKMDQIYEMPCSVSAGELDRDDAPDPEDMGDSALVIAQQIPIAAESSTVVAVEGVHQVLEPEVEHAEGGVVYSQTILPHHNRMQSLVDLVMWRDISRTSFVFGTGTFLVISCSYAKDISFSITSAVSYLGLVYLAVIFLLNCILDRGGVVVAEDEESNRMWLVGEDEAIWIIRMLLPYVNEILFKLRALFSGDPATTMKLAVFLFALARCGGSITVGTMAKMAFFGAFTVPKLLAAYSHRIARYGKFWVERFRDAWDSCTHKKAVAAGVFTLVWNLSSAVARVWALFMLVVVLRYYQMQRADTDWSCDPPSNTGAEDKHPTQPEQEQQQQQPQLRQWRRGGVAQPATASPSSQGLSRRSGSRPFESAAAVKERKKAF